MPFHAYTGVVLTVRQQVFSAFSKPVLESSAGKGGVSWVFIFPEDVNRVALLPLILEVKHASMYIYQKKKEPRILNYARMVDVFFFSLT